MMVKNIAVAEPLGPAGFGSHAGTIRMGSGGCRR
jgi:hypothetical protein